MPKISVIVPVYKVELYLRRCVDSILSQTFKDFELLLVNDGSPDNCPYICDEYAKRDCRINVIHKNNGGLSSARNAGLDVAKGDYITFVDSDDWVADNYLEKLLDILVSTKSDISICNAWRVSNKHKKTEENLPSLPSTTFNSFELFWLVKKSSYIYTISCAKLFKSSILTNIRFKEGVINEDEYFANDIYKQNIQVSILNDRLYYYYFRNDSISQIYHSFDPIDSHIQRLNIVKRNREYRALYSSICYLLLDEMMSNNRRKNITFKCSIVMRYLSIIRHGINKRHGIKMIMTCLFLKSR